MTWRHHEDGRHSSNGSGGGAGSTPARVGVAPDPLAQNAVFKTVQLGIAGERPHSPKHPQVSGLQIRSGNTVYKFGPYLSSTTLVLYR